MRWEDFRRSDNIDDDRGGGYRMPGVRIGMRGGGLGIGAIIVLGLVGWVLGIDPSVLIGGAELANDTASQYQQTHRDPASRSGAPSDRTGDFVAAIVGNTEGVWSDIFRSGGARRLHSWFLGAAPALGFDRPEDRDRRSLQYLLRRPALGSVAT